MTMENKSEWDIAAEDKLDQILSFLTRIKREGGTEYASRTEWKFLSETVEEMISLTQEHRRQKIFRDEIDDMARRLNKLEREHND